MNSPQIGSSGGARPPRRPGKKSAAGIALACAAAVYTFLVPIVNERWGTDLPGLNHGGGQAVASTQQTSDAPGPRADQRTPSATQSTAKTWTADDRSSPTYGFLRDLGGENYISPAGLIYSRGSQEGHRLKHVERHTRDMPGRPIHGVFDGGMPNALATIDEAYERAQKKQGTTVKNDHDRTIYVVDMGSRIGFIGGQAGQRKRKPMARQVQLVLEENRVITAYPR